MTSPSLDTRLRVRVPGSTSNLGTGFDCLGLALGLWLEVELTFDAASPAWAIEGPAAGDWSPGEDDLLDRAFREACRAWEIDTPPPRWRVRTDLPVARGLGSSGAAVAAGLLLASALCERPVDDAARLELGLRLEGHPDNVTASLHGGCTLCVPPAEEHAAEEHAAQERSLGAPSLLHLQVSERLAFAVAWPDVVVETPRARAVLPTTVPHADAVENARRLPLLLEGLRSGDPRLLREGARDRLHEAFRLPLIPGGAEARAAAREAGAHVAVLSGSGSALVAIADPERAEDAARAMADALRAASGAGTGRRLEVVRGAPAVERIGP